MRPRADGAAFGAHQRPSRAKELARRLEQVEARLQRHGSAIGVVVDEEVDAKTIRLQDGPDPSVVVRKARRALVGQVVSLRRTFSPPLAAVRQSPRGGLTTRRRLTTCPTQPQRIDFHVEHPRSAWWPTKSRSPSLP